MTPPANQINQNNSTQWKVFKITTVSLKRTLGSQTDAANGNYELCSEQATFINDSRVEIFIIQSCSAQVNCRFYFHLISSQFNHLCDFLPDRGIRNTMAALLKTRANRQAASLKKWRHFCPLELTSLRPGAPRHRHYLSRNLPLLWAPGSSIPNCRCIAQERGPNFLQLGIIFASFRFSP